MVLKYFSKVYIVCLLRDEYLNKSCFTNPNMPSQEKLYSDSFQKIASEDILVNDQSYKEIELKPLKMKELYQVIRKRFEIKQIAYLSSIYQKDSSDNRAGSDDEDDEDDEEKEKQLNFRYIFFSRIKDELKKDAKDFLLNFLYLKTEGNPMRTINWIQNMIDQRMLIVKKLNPPADVIE